MIKNVSYRIHAALTSSVRSRQVNTPRDHQSTAWEYGSPRLISGAVKKFNLNIDQTKNYQCTLEMHKKASHLSLFKRELKTK